MKKASGRKSVKAAGSKSASVRTKPADARTPTSPGIGFDPLFLRIVTILEDARARVVRAVNSEMVLAYWHIGRELVEHLQAGDDRAEYGRKLIDERSARLTARLGRGFSTTNIRYFRAFYLAYADRNPAIRHIGSGEFALPPKPAAERHTSRRSRNSSVGELEGAAVVVALDNALASRGHVLERPVDAIKQPYVLDFLDLPESHRLRESDLEGAILEKLQHFLLELGKGFAFVARQKRLSFEDEHFYVDLVFYNIVLKCYLLVDLKLGKLTHQDVGQMDGYVRLFNAQGRDECDGPTIGLILCAEKNEAVARYSVLHENEQLFAAKYVTYLPSVKELERELSRERGLVEARSQKRTPACSALGKKVRKPRSRGQRR